MHAVVVEVAIDDPEAANQGLGEVVDAVRQAPGFVGGYWVRIAKARGISIVVFETEEQAAAAAPPTDGGAAGVRVGTVAVGEVMASA